MSSNILLIEDNTSDVQLTLRAFHRSHIRNEPRIRRMPVVILTSSREEQNTAAGYDLGASSYLRKPVNFSDFVTGAEQIGLYWLVLNEPAAAVR